MNSGYFFSKIMITFVKMIAEMETIARESAPSPAVKKKAAPKKQVIFRLEPELLERIKFKAAQKGLSLNAFIETYLAELVKHKIPHLPEDFVIDPVIDSFRGLLSRPTQKELEEDTKLERIWRHHHETDER